MYGYNGFRYRGNIRRIQDPRQPGSFPFNGGFTLMELIVVIALMGILLSITLPRFQDMVGMDPNRKVSVWLIGQVRLLKERAVNENRQFVLNISLDSGKLWVTDPSMSEEAVMEAEESGFELPDGFRITDVAFPEETPVTMGRAAIRFHEKGYSDKALIHVENDDGDTLSFLVESFLPRARRFDEYVEFDE